MSNLTNKLASIKKLYQEYSFLKEDFPHIEAEIQLIEQQLEQEAPKSELNPHPDLVALFERLQCLLQYNELTSGRYERWANGDNNYYLATTEHAELIAAVGAINPQDAFTYLSLYDTHRGTIARENRRAYRNLARVADDIHTIRTSITIINTHTQEYVNFNNTFAEVASAGNALDLNTSEGDYYVTSPEAVPLFQNHSTELDNLQTTLNNLPQPTFKSLQERISKFIAARKLATTAAINRTALQLNDITVQPLPHPEHDSFRTRRLTGPLFSSPRRDALELDIASNDPEQGKIGDCYLISSLIGLADKYPDVIRNAIATSTSGEVVRYEVTLHVCTSATDETLRRQVVVIDNTFVTSGRNSAYAPQADQRELWPLVIEKAIAKFLGGYEILEGGTNADILRLLTGREPDKRDTDSFNNSTDLHNYFSSHQQQLITIGTKSRSAITATTYTITQLSDSEGLTESYSIELSNSSIIYCKHAYYVDHYDSNRQEVHLINPHSTTENNKKKPVVSLQFLLDCASNITST